MQAPRTHRLAALLLLLCLLFPMAAAVNDPPDAAPTLRVGYIDYTGFIDRQRDGSYTGYGADYLAAIANYTGYHYQYVYGQWSELLQKLENREIDLLCTAQYTETRAAKYDYSAYPIGYTQGLLYTRSDNKDLYYEDFAAFDGMTVGVLADGAMTAVFRDYAAHNDFSCQYRTFQTESDMVAALQVGELDAVCSEHLANHPDLLLLANFGADAYYIISYQDSPYIADINNALRQIKSNVDFESNLYHQYYDSSAAETTLQFTTAEKDYIEHSGTLRAGLPADRSPFSSYDAATGTMSGISVDVLEHIAAESGLSFTYLPIPNDKTSPELLSSGDFDLLCGVERDNFTTSETLVSTVSFLDSAIVPVGRAGETLDLSSPLRVAVPIAFQALQKKLALQYPNMSLLLYPTNQDCLAAVLAGEAELSIQNTHILSLLLQKPQYGALDILPVEMMTEHTAIALPRQDNGTLLAILNKCIGNIDDATASTMLLRHTFAMPYRYSLGDFVYKFRLEICIIGALVLLVFLLLLSVIVTRSQARARLQAQNRLLADAVAQADRASSAKSQFLSRMSHEIRTPMNAIVGLTEIARLHERTPEDIDSYLDKIAVSSRVLLDIINDVLDMSAIENNKLQIAAAPFDLKQVLGGIRTIYYPQCRAKGVRFEMATDVQNELLVGDALRVSQILFNFVSNAFKFTDAGGSIRIDVQQTALREQTAFLRFSISDTGCGMSEELQARLFRPFEQESSDTAQKHGGSGLGLSIAKNMIDLMHGAVTVQSRKGEGTTFLIDLPFGISREDGLPHAADAASAFRNLRVLAVDDDPDARQYSSLVLRRLQVPFDCAASGEQALTLLQQAEAQGQPYNICLIDWKMPDMDGITLTRRIRALEKQNMTVIIISAYDINEVQAQAKDAGADHFISKPLFQSTLFNILMTLSQGANAPLPVQSAQYDFTGCRALLAEDQPLNAEIAIELLQLVHLEVDHVADGQQALARFSDAAPGTYDVILLDVQMPVMDGYAAARAIRALPRPDAKTIPIFAMTANAFTEDIAAALSAGMNGHIAKPIDTALLYETLHRAIPEK